jgi:hypothetical protein
MSQKKSQTALQPLIDHILDYEVKLNHNYFPEKLKTLTYKTLVRPVFTYATENWTERRLSYLREENPSQNIGLICERRQWPKRYSRELEELYNESNIVTVMKSSTLRWTANVVRIDENELWLNILWTNPGGQRGRGRPKSRWIDGVRRGRRKENGLQKIGWRLPRVTGDIA